jgi:hypothetical protein
MPEVPFTQYVPPDGHTIPCKFEVTKDIHEIAEALMMKGYHFDVEVLSTGLVSLTVEHDSLPDDDVLYCISHEIGRNEKDEMEVLVNTLFRNAYAFMMGH